MLGTSIVAVDWITAAAGSSSIWRRVTLRCTTVSRWHVERDWASRHCCPDWRSSVIATHQLYSDLVLHRPTATTVPSFHFTEHLRNNTNIATDLPLITPSLPASSNPAFITHTGTQRGMHRDRQKYKQPVLVCLMHCNQINHLSVVSDVAR